MVNHRNTFQDFLTQLDEKAKKRILVRIVRIADNYGFETTNRELLKYLASYGVWEIKLHNPGCRILCCPYEDCLILLNGFEKRSDKARKQTRAAYQKGSDFVKMLLENEDVTKEKLEQAR